MALPCKLQTLVYSMDEPIRTVRYKIDYYDTPYGVPSNGFFAEYYDNPSYNTSKTFVSGDKVVDGKDNILAYDWSNGVPPGVVTPGFKAKYYGYFCSRKTDTTYFSIVKNPKSKAVFYFDKSRKVNDPSLSSNFHSQSTSLYVVSDWDNPTGIESNDASVGSLTINRWYPFLLEYCSTEQPNYLSLCYNYSAESDVIPLSAGISSAIKSVSGTVISGWISPVTISGVNSVNLTTSLNESNILEFEVPLLTFSNDVDLLLASGRNGFYYNKSLDSYIDNLTNKPIRLGRMVKYSAGYYLNKDVYTATGFPFPGDPFTSDTLEINDYFTDVACGDAHVIYLRDNGSLWLFGGDNSYGETDAPSPNAGFISVAAGSFHSLGLKSDGSITGWGDNSSNQCTVPSPNTDFIAIAGGLDFSLGLKSNGTITGWGSNTYGQCLISGANSNFVAIAAGDYHGIGVKSDGTVTGWGRNHYAQTTITGTNSNFIAVAAGLRHSMGLKSDGTIVCWGSDGNGQRSVPSPNSGFIAIDAGMYYSVGIKSDGSITGWGDNVAGQLTVPSPNSNYYKVAAGTAHIATLKKDLNNKENILTRFTGIITDISTDLSKGNSTLKFKCQDILYRPMTSIVENFPNQLSYAYNNFTSDEESGQPNGITRPVTYDSWPIKEAIIDLLIKSNIDPVLLYSNYYQVQKNPDSVYNYAVFPGVEFGNSNVYCIDDNDIVLNRKSRYGNPFGSQGSVNTDDKYIWSFDFGTPIYDAVNKITNTYGFNFYVNNSGYIVFNSASAPKLYIASTGSDSGFGSNYLSNCTEVNDLKADGGKYVKIVNTTPGEAYYTSLFNSDLEGSAFSFNFVKHNIPFSTLSGSQGWYLPKDEPFAVQLPSRNSNYYPFGLLYARDVSGYDTNHLSTPPNGYVYYSSQFIFKPKVNLTISSITYYSMDKDSAMIYADGNNDPNYHSLSADIYIGRITDISNPQNFTTSSLVVADYKRNPIGKLVTLENGTSLREHTIDLDNDYIVTSGNTYGIKFLAHDNSFPPAPYHDEEGNFYRNIGFSIAMSITPCDSTYTISTYTCCDIDHKNRSPETFSNVSFITNKSYDPHNTGKNVLAIPYMNFNKKVDAANLNNKTRLDVFTIHNQIGYYELINSFEIDNYYVDYTNDTTKKLRYPSDGEDYMGVNPCKFYLQGNLLVTGDNGLGHGIKPSYDQYKFYLYNCAPVGVTGTMLTSIETYVDDVYQEKFVFDTAYNISKLSIDQSIEDIRNDIIVVGDLIGAFREYFTNNLINPNNQTNQYVYSRAIDIDSISNPEARNNVGQRKPFIIFEPTIVDQKHADWLAKNVLFRYSSKKKNLSWDSFGIPFLEPNDCVLVNNEFQDGIITDSNQSPYQWITSISEKATDGSYSMSFAATPFKPWSAFSQYATPNPSSFDNNYIVNIQMTDSMDRIRGYRNSLDTAYIQDSPYDVYETESGNQLKIKYDQVVDADVIIKVVSRDVLGSEEERSVAYLVGAFDPESGEIPEYRQWGTDYELFWDGVDQTGNTRKKLGQSSTVTTGIGTVTIDNTDYISSFADGGFFAPEGRYCVRFIVIPKNSNYITRTITTKEIPITYNQTMATRLSITSTDSNDGMYEQAFYLKWGDPLYFNMLVSGNSVYAGSIDRNITYNPNNCFYEDENSDMGIKFTFACDSDTNRTIYYKSEMNHIWGLGNKFYLRTGEFDYNLLDTSLYAFLRYSYDEKANWYWAFKYAVSAYRMYMQSRSFGKYNQNTFVTGLDYSDNVSTLEQADWLSVGHINLPTALVTGHFNCRRGSATTNVVGNEIDSVMLDASYYYYIENGYNAFVSYFNTPYTTYTKEYISSRTKRITTNDSSIEFYFDPESQYAGGWTFEDLPDLGKYQYDSIRGLMALHAYFNGPKEEMISSGYLRFITSHAFQLNTVIWDGTGRIQKTRNQTNALMSGEQTKHTHTMHGFSVPEHTHNTKKECKLTINSYDDGYNLWGGKGVVATDEYYKMITSGLSFTPNDTKTYGIGLDVISGSKYYGWFSWHGYWNYGSKSSKILPSGIPFNILGAQDTQFATPIARTWFVNIDDQYIPNVNFDNSFGIADDKHGVYIDPNKVYPDERSHINVNYAGIVGIPIVYYHGTLADKDKWRILYLQSGEGYNGKYLLDSYLHSDEVASITGFLSSLKHAHPKKYETIHTKQFGEIFDTDSYNHYFYYDENGNHIVDIDRLGIMVISGAEWKHNGPDEAKTFGRTIVYKLGEPSYNDIGDGLSLSIGEVSPRLDYNPIAYYRSKATHETHTLETGNSNAMANVRWYEVDKTLPWGAAANYTYFTNFLIASGFKFNYGGWSELSQESDTNTIG